MSFYETNLRENEKESEHSQRLQVKFQSSMNWKHVEGELIEAIISSIKMHRKKNMP